MDDDYYFLMEHRFSRLPLKIAVDAARIKYAEVIAGSVVGRHDKLRRRHP